MPLSDPVLEELGRAVVADGRLHGLQMRLGFSTNAMAELIYVSPATYKNWIRNPDTHMWPATARQVGRLFTEATTTLSFADEDGFDLTTMVPYHRAAMELGWPQETLLDKYRNDEITGVDLDVLGMWMTKAELSRLRGARGNRRVAAA